MKFSVVITITAIIVIVIVAGLATVDAKPAISRRAISRYRYPSQRYIDAKLFNVSTLSKFIQSINP
jgi:hypothetical protein